MIFQFRRVSTRGAAAFLAVLFALSFLSFPSAAEDSDLNFSADLKAYEPYMSPTDRDSYLILVNRTHPIPKEQVPEDLTEIANTRADGRAAQRMRECAAKALEALFLEAEALGYLDKAGAEGHVFSVTSGYRSYEYQESLFQIYQHQYESQGMTEAEAYKRTSRTTALPGESEHQTGLCVDMHDRICATTQFEESEIYAWLSDNAWKFGFILRYPKGKEDVTGYSFEPWHYRFVGRYHAEKMYRDGLCLEEYTEKAGQS